ncbi:MAG: Hpt domain-containing protein [Lachnospiraceae bacterium]|nr:Hpt domain-containing protein [Lachnospiraceae bacterium]
MTEVTKDEYFDAVRNRLPELDYNKGLATCAGDRDFYLELLQDFTELPIKEELNKFLEAGDAHNYCIRVHGFKNNAYSVGAVEIGDLAYELERLTKESVWDGVPGKQTYMFELYDSVRQRYGEVRLTSE